MDLLTQQDWQFKTLFSRGEVPISQFTHKAHIQLAWIHLMLYGQEDAVNNISEQIKKLYPKGWGYR